MRSARFAAAAAAAMIALAPLVAGCSNSTSSTSPTSTSTTASSSVSTPASTATTTGGASTTTTAKPTTTASASASASGSDAATPALPPPGNVRRTDGAYEDFTSPSANIGCVIVDEQARCDIRERTWSPPPAPADCELDFGQGIAMGVDGNAQLVCAGDTALSGAPPLAYGNSIQNGDMRCTSTEAEMICFNVGNGHGFAISRQNYRIF